MELVSFLDGSVGIKEDKNANKKDIHMVE